MRGNASQCDTFVSWRTILKRRRSWAFNATMIVDALMAIARAGTLLMVGRATDAIVLGADSAGQWKNGSAAWLLEWCRGPGLDRTSGRSVRVAGGVMDVATEVRNN